MKCIETMQVKWIVLLVLVFVISIRAATNTIVLAWDYPSADITNAGTNGYTFKLYSSPLLNTNFAAWLALTNLNGDITNAVLMTNGLATFQQTISMTPGQMFFFCSASNFWGESTNSNLVSAPPVAQSPTLRIRKGP